MMLEWYWYFVFYLLLFHIKCTVHTIYVHRTVGHGHFMVSKPLEYFFRFILWTGSQAGPRWAETYASRHRKHHVTSDSDQDPHSPYNMTFQEMCTNWKVDPLDADRYCPEIKTPDDWMQKTLHEKYNNVGPWVIHILSLILFGPIGFILSVVMRYITKDWLSIFVGNYINHKLGFDYAGHRHPTDKSKNVFPLGLLLAGEELHNNHHNYPKEPNFRRFWFEIDLGYVYAKILSYMGLLKIKKEIK